MSRVKCLTRARHNVYVVAAGRRPLPAIMYGRFVCQQIVILIRRDMCRYSNGPEMKRFLVFYEKERVQMKHGEEYTEKERDGNCSRSRSPYSKTYYRDFHFGEIRRGRRMTVTFRRGKKS